MKNLFKLVPVILILCLLSGCYASDSTVKFNYDGTIKYDSTFVATKAMFDQTPNGTDVIDMAVQQLKEDAENNPGAYEEFTIEPYYPDGKPGEAGTDEKTAMYGIKTYAKFSDFDRFANSTILRNAMPNIIIRRYNEGNSPLKSSIDIETKNTFFGTKYVGSGSINIFGDNEEYFKANNPDYKTATKSATMEITLKFPFSFFKSNASSKNMLTNSLTWRVNGNDTPTVPVSFDVFVVNPVVLFESLIIIILLVLYFIMLRKRRNEEEAPLPDEYYTDEEGNVIPVYYDDDESDIDEEEIEDENELLDMISEEIESENEQDTDVEEILPEAEPEDDSENDKSSDSSENSDRE